jgi:Sigma-70 region 2
MKAHVHLRTFDGRAKFSTWLTRIVINSALMTLRRKRAHLETSMEITDGDTWQHWEIAHQTKNVEEVYVRHERIELLRRAICRLQPPLRNVVEIHQSNDRSAKEAWISQNSLLPQLSLVCYTPEEPCVRVWWKDERSNAPLFKKGIDKCSIYPGRRQCTRLGHEIGRHVHFAFALGTHWLMGDKNNYLDVSRLAADTRD